MFLCRDLWSEVLSQNIRHEGKPSYEKGVKPHPYREMEIEKKSKWTKYK
jgi:hypothetical protein